MLRTFEMVREEDESGVSGTGKVLEGVVFSDGTCVTRWTSDKSPAHSTTFWPNFGSFIVVHVAPHPDNKTKIKFSDGELYDHTTVTKPADDVRPIRRRGRPRKNPILGMVPQPQP